MPARAPEGRGCPHEGPMLPEKPRSPSLARALPPAAVLSLAALLLPHAARADMRVWTSDEKQANGDPVSFLDLTAFAQPGYIIRSPFEDDPNAGVTDSGPWLQRARSGFWAQIQPWLLMRVETELAPVPLLQDAFLEARPSPYFQIRMGQFIVPFLHAFRFNELNLGFLDRPIYTPVTPDRAYLRYLAPRDIGLMLHGAVGSTNPAHYDPVFEYRIGAFLGRGPNVTRNDDDALMYTARAEFYPFGLPKGREAESDLAYSPYPKLGVGAGVYSNCDDRANWNRGFTVDGEYRFRGLYGSAGFVWIKNGPSSALGDTLGYGKSCVGSTAASGDPITFVSRGLHAQVQYVVPESILPLGGHALEGLLRFDWVDPVSPFSEGNPLFGGGAKSAEYIPPANFTDSDNAPTQWRMTFGVNWFPTHAQSLRVSLNYQLRREAEDAQTTEGYIVGIKNDILWLQLTAGF